MHRRDHDHPTDPTIARSRPRSLESVFQHCLKLATEVLLTRAEHFDHVINVALSSADLKFNVPAGMSAGKGEHSFGRTLCHHFRTKVTAQFAQLLSEQATREAPRTGKTALDLVPVEESELRAQKSSLASSIAAAVEQDLLLLNRNLAALVGCEQVGEAQSPFAPAVLIDAAIAALAARGFEGKLATALLRPIGFEATRPLKLIYSAINTYFGEEPPLHRPRQRAEGPAVAARSRAAGAAATAAGHAPAVLAKPGAPAVAGFAHLPVAPPSDPYVIDLLVNLLASGWRVGAPAPLLPGAALPLVMVPGGGVLARAQADDGDYRDADRNDDRRNANGDTRNLHDEARLAGSLAGLSELSQSRPGDEYAEELKLFTQWRSGIRDLLLDVPRRVAFDLVASLFDAMCRCDLVPVQFRQRMLGVQSSLLASAIQNPSAYFLTHRMLVQAFERLAASSVGSVQPNDLLGQAWDDALDALLQFAEEPGAYKQELQKVIERAEALAERTEHADTSARATAARQAIGWMRRAVPRAAKDSVLREFLLWTWSSVLARAMADARVAEVLTPRYLKAARTAVWSVQLMRTDAQRGHLKRAIAELLRTLKEGMRLIKLDSAAELTFLSRLMEAHRRALGLEQGAPPVDRRVSAPNAAPDQPDSLDVESLREGEHYMLRAGTGLLRLKLHAKGSAERPWLFVGEDGSRPLFLAADSITLLLRDGTLRPCTTAANEATEPADRLEAREAEATARLRALLTRAR